MGYFFPTFPYFSLLSLYFGKTEKERKKNSRKRKKNSRKKKRTGKHIARIERDKLKSLEKPDFTKAINFDVLDNMNSKELRELEKI